MSLPRGFRVRISDGVHRTSDGTGLVGGTPLRAMRFTGRAAGLIAGREIVVEDDLGSAVVDRLLDANIAVPVLDSSHERPADEVTVVVPIRDRVAQLDRLLGSLAGLNVIVVDDASSDAASIAATAERHRARVVRLAVNAGPAAARNAGLEEVRTPLVAFIDSDIDATPQAILALTRHFADPSVVLVGPHVRARAVNSTPRWFERYETTTPSLGLGDRPSVVRPGARVGWLPSATLVGRTDALRGGFDSAMRVGEDVDLVWRLASAGHRIRYDPSVEVWHDTRGTLTAWLGRKAFYGTGGASLARRHPGHLVNAVISAPMGLAALALLTRRPAAIPLTAAAIGYTVTSLHRTLPDFPDRTRVAGQLAGQGLWWAVRQESALLLRFWWPATLAASLVSREARRVTLTALVVDTVAAAIEHPDRVSVANLAGRRADDLAYGAGLWWGAMRDRVPAALAIRISGRRAGVDRSPRQSRNPR